MYPRHHKFENEKRRRAKKKKRGCRPVLFCKFTKYRCRERLTKKMVFFSGSRDFWYPSQKFRRPEKKNPQNLGVFISGHRTSSFRFWVFLWTPCMNNRLQIGSLVEHRNARLHRIRKLEGVAKRSFTPFGRNATSGERRLVIRFEARPGGHILVTSPHF